MTNLTTESVCSVLIVDDEPVARRGLKRVVKDISNVEIAGECRNGIEAVDFIQHNHVDIVLLDVQMPGLDGFGVIRELGSNSMPLVLFITAYEQYAIQAFEVHAFDYLLKPVEEDRLRGAIERAVRDIVDGATARSGEQIRELLEYLDTSRQTEKLKKIRRLPVKESGRIHFLDIEDIYSIEAAGNYILVHARDGSHLVRQTMKKLDNMLPDHNFIRVSRSSLVNIDHVKEISSTGKGEYIIELMNDQAIKCSRTFKARLEELLHFMI
jgi:two-component system LytT family response regulator